MREAEAARNAAERRNAPAGSGRNILFITVDQQRFDALGANGGGVARTPHLDRLARTGINYQRCHVQNVVCMPSRSTMLTGQHPRTHGVIANGISLPTDAPNIAAYLRRSGGYHSALIGKAHFDPHLDLALRFAENRLAAEGSTGPWRGFDHVELATHGPLVGHHYADWLWRAHPEDIAGFAGVLSGEGGGDTAAPEVAHNPVPREHYHTDWVAERTCAWLRRRAADEPWLCWMSFPDPHHPFDPPYDEVRARIDWRDTPLPAGYPGSVERARTILAAKPRHWLDWYEGRFLNPEGGPTGFVPRQLSRDQFREINAMIHVENELIDEAVGQVLRSLERLG
ncbi:MAG TPA: sulfatase, partial [Sorangium sp.]|nr:sulfatase [Sorangium sp.]